MVAAESVCGNLRLCYFSERPIPKWTIQLRALHVAVFHREFEVNSYCGCVMSVYLRHFPLITAFTQQMLNMY